MQVNIYYFINYCFIALLSVVVFPVYAQFTEMPHRPLEAGEIPVSAPGYYGEAGKTYVLTNNISSTGTPVFLGNNVTLDLNGYEITYADAAYEHIPNYSFEDGLVGWDFSKAPNAKIENTKVQVFVGDKVLSMRSGEEITSQYITLPVADRSYFAMCGVAKIGMAVSIYVEDENGNIVESTNPYGSSQKVGSPAMNKTVQLGGGFAYAHFRGKPAGKYRIRIKANNNVIIDHIDIRPAMDVGVGIVEKTNTNAHTDYMHAGGYSPAFYDYTSDFANSKPLEGIPVVANLAKGTVTIKNGTIRSGARGILSWGIQSTAKNVELHLDNVKVVSSGINTNAVEAPQAIIANCHFDIDSPFIINRHGSSFYAVDLRGSVNSEVYNSAFYGGQGCLTIKGHGTKVYNNYFENRQTVTNHYSIMAGAPYAEIYNNVFKPEVGSGVEIYMGNNIHIYDNEFHIIAGGPTAEYGHEDYSTNAIRLADYNATWGSTKGAFKNRIYGNTFHITGRDFPEHPSFIPVATAVFYSASAGDNYIYDNEVVVNALDPDSKARTSAFYVGGGTIGGVFENNTVTTNVPAFWLASPYGNATKTKVLRNTIIKAPDAKENYAPIRFGSGNYLATDIEFVSNKIVGGNGKFEFDGTSREHTYSYGWELKVKVVDQDGSPLPNQHVVIYNKKNEVVAEEATSETGSVSAILNEYLYHGRLERSENPYKVTVGDKEVEITLEEDTEIEIKLSTVTGIKQGDATGLIYGPNPVDTNLEILFHNSTERTVSILDMSTKLHYESTIHSKQAMIDTSFLVAGIYLLQIIENKSVVTKKLVKL